MIVKSARKAIPSSISISIKSIKFNSLRMTNTIQWSVDNPNKENILSYDFIIFQNDSSSGHGSVKSIFELFSDKNQYVHRNVEIFTPDGKFFKNYNYQVVCYTDTTSKASEIEKMDPREIYEVDPPSQVTFSIRNSKIYFSIRCPQNKFASNIFIFRKIFSDDVFERIGVLPYNEALLFVDNKVSLGSFYEYRFMTYDIFGHFSQKIVKIDIFMWDKNYKKSKTNILMDPIPYAEYASESSKEYIKLRVSNVDQNCLQYIITRRDLSESRNTFDNVEQWGASGSLLRSENGSSVELSFLDTIIRGGSFYQYAVKGIDKFGNETDIRQSNIVWADVSGSLPATPINLRGEIINQYPTAVRLEWTDDNLNQTLNNVVSGSSPLFPRDNLYYFKIFRRKYDELNFKSYPEQSSSFFVDSCDDDGVTNSQNHPYYQPTPPMRDTKYYYYVATYDSSTNIVSNRSAEILVDLTVPPSQVTSLEAYYNDVFEPLKCILSWKTDENDKTLDNFIIERIEEGGLWTEVGKSYFNTQFVDTTIYRDKRYLYRVKAADFNGNMGVWSFIPLQT